MKSLTQILSLTQDLLSVIKKYIALFLSLLFNPFDLVTGTKLNPPLTSEFILQGF